MNKSLAALAAVGMLAASGTAYAAPVATVDNVEFYLKQNTFPSGLQEEQVFLDKGTGTSITGNVGSQTGQPETLFTSTNTLDAANGFANIKGINNSLMSNITFQIPGYTFGDLKFDVNFQQQAAPTGTQLKVSAFDTSNALIASYSGFQWGNGENKILVLATNGVRFGSILIEALVAGERVNVIDQFKQFEVSEIPLPPAALLFGTALAGMGFLGRRKKAAANA